MKPQAVPERKTETKTPEKKPRKKRRIFGPIITVLFIVFVLYGGLYSISSFFDTYKLIFQSPVIIQAPLILEHRQILSPVPSPEASPSPTPLSMVRPVEAKERPSDYEIVSQKKNGAILWKVYMLESSIGKNDGCRDKGKFNGFGYGQNKSVWNCFDYFEEVVYKVDNWFETKLAVMSIPEALCLYNTGIQQQDCDYYQNYLSL